MEGKSAFSRKFIIDLIIFACFPRFFSRRLLSSLLLVTYQCAQSVNILLQTTTSKCFLTVWSRKCFSEVVLMLTGNSSCMVPCSVLMLSTIVIQLLIYHIIPCTIFLFIPRLFQKNYIKKYLLVISASACVHNVFYIRKTSVLGQAENTKRTFKVFIRKCHWNMPLDLCLCRVGAATRM